MPPTLFLALQCFQCSTMQVKQQRKPGAKWVCVVCNAKQSVRKVYAQGSCAPDLRHFVQNFNMSRIEPTTDYRRLSPTRNASNGDELVNKKRTDWSEYLDLDQKQEEDDDHEEDVRFVTDLPTKMCSKSFRKHAPCTITGTEERSKESFKPKFPNSNQKIQVPKEESSRKRQRTVETPRSLSKWNEYVEAGEKSLCLPRMEHFELSGNEHSLAEEAIFDDVTVEEEVHPDFR